MASSAVNIPECMVYVHLGCGDGTKLLKGMVKTVGPTGFAIGLETSEETLSLARKNAKSHGLSPPHVAFAKANWTEELPLASNSVNYIFSAQVMAQLSDDEKGFLLKEIHRILKPGGQMIWLGKKELHRRPIQDGMIIPLGPDQEPFKFAPSNLELELEYPDPPSRPPVDVGFSELLQAAGFQREDFNDGIVSKSSSNESTSQAAGTSTTAMDTPLLRSWDAFPAVRATSLPRITADELAEYMRDQSKGAMDYTVIDVRRNDYGGGHVRGSHQRPAQTFHNDLERFYDEFGKTKEVIFYCGSSSGRGPRCAGWYQDFLDDLRDQGETIISKAVVLEGGVKNWLAKFASDDELVDRD